MSVEKGFMDDRLPNPPTTGITVTIYDIFTSKECNEWKLLLVKYGN